MLGGLLQPKAGLVASGRRPERRRRNWTREAPELAARETQEGTYQARGHNVMGQFLRVRGAGLETGSKGLCFVH